MSIKFTVHNESCYIKLPSNLDPKIADEIENELVEKVSDYNLLVLDLSDVEKFHRKAIRPLVTLQNLFRKGLSDRVVVVQPALKVKKELIEQGAIRPKEICPSVAQLRSFLMRPVQTIQRGST